MTTMVSPLIGAASSKVKWNSINWNTIEAEVYRMQMRIAKAIREGRHGKVKALQWLLTHSFNAKLLAVKRVTQNQGSKTPGIDNVTWTTPQQKLKAAQSLKRRGYQPQPLKRIYIPKKDKDDRKRPLSIPTMFCRAVQALHLLALEPIAEHLSDKNSYGFRPKRSCADAMEMCRILLSKGYSSQFILEGDIKSCFDKISHQWLRDNITMDKEILNKWLAADFIEKGELYATDSGTPQGGIASPTLLNLTLSGLEETVIRATSIRKDKVHVVTYADDFIITGSSKFAYIDHQIFIALWQWVHRRHPRKGAPWRKRKYFRSHNLRNWIFTAKISKGDSKVAYLDLFEAGSVPIKRHIKIRSNANPFDPQFKEYFEQRANIVKGSQRVSTQQTYPNMHQV